MHLPEEAADVLRAVNQDESLPSWALRFAASLPGVLTVLSGMSTPDQVSENTQIMRSFHPLTHEEDEALARVRAILDGVPTVPCTDCRYCLKNCPKGVRIPADELERLVASRMSYLADNEDFLRLLAERMPHISTRTAGDALFNFDLLLDGFTLEDLAEILPLVFEKVTLTAEGELELVRRDLSAADGAAGEKKGGAR